MFGYPHHVDLTVSDIDRSVTFYQEVLSRLKYLRTREYIGEAPCWVYAGSGLVFSIALHEARSNAAHDRYAPGLHHLAFNAQSREDVDSIFNFLRDSGIEILDPPAEYSYSLGYYAVFFADPDGIKLEVVFEPTSTTMGA